MREKLTQYKATYHYKTIFGINQFKYCLRLENKAVLLYWKRFFNFKYKCMLDLILNWIKNYLPCSGSQNISA